jgi:hypothetical protein
VVNWDENVQNEDHSVFGFLPIFFIGTAGTDMFAKALQKGTHIDTSNREQNLEPTKGSQRKRGPAVLGILMSDRTRSARIVEKNVVGENLPPAAF